MGLTNQREAWFLTAGDLPPTAEGLEQLEQATGLVWRAAGQASPLESWGTFLAMCREARGQYIALLGERAALMGPEIVAAAGVHLESLPFGREQRVALARRALVDLAGMMLFLSAGKFSVEVLETFDLRIHPSHPAALVAGDLVESARALKVFRLCGHCGAPFSFSRPSARYCSTSCRVLASRQRQEQGEADDGDGEAEPETKRA